MYFSMYGILVIAFLQTVIVTARPDKFDGVKITASSARSLDLPELDSFDTNLNVHRNAARDRSHRWPGGVIPFIIKDDFPEVLQKTILKAMKEIEEDVRTRTRLCIQYVPRTSERNYLEVRTGRGCTTEVGFYDKGPHYSTLAAQCAIKGVIVHELIHSLGFYHEQNRYDRALAINMNLTNIREEYLRDFNIRNSSVLDIQGTAYDMKSIMHYAPYTMAKDPMYPVITPKANSTPGIQLGQRYGLSETDVLKIQRYYGCPEDTSHIRSDLSPENSVFTCTFENDSCGMTQSDGHDLTWEYRSSPTSDGPIAGATTGTDPFLYVSSLFAGQISNSSDNRPRLTASISTPLLDVPDGDATICLDFQVFHAGPTTYLEIYVSGPQIPRQSLYNYKDTSVKRWTIARIVSTLPKGLEFRLEFVAEVQDGPLAIDNVYVLKGYCQ